MKPLIDIASECGLPVRKLQNGSWHVDGYFGVNILQKLTTFAAAAIAQHQAKALEAMEAGGWLPMDSAPKDGTVVLVLLDGSDIPHPARWLSGPDDPNAYEQTKGPGWHLTWDGWPIPEHDGPRYWMHCPIDPDA